MNLRTQLRHLLESNHLSAAELSRRSGVSKQSISDWLGGVEPRSIVQVKKVADSFGVSLDFIFFGSEIDAARARPRVPSGPAKPASRASPAWRAYWTAMNGQFYSTSPSFSETLGWSAEELNGRVMIELVHFSDRNKMSAQMSEQIESDGAFSAIDSRYLCRNGEIKWIRWSAVASHEEGVIRGACTDLSEKYPVERDVNITLPLSTVIQEAVASCRCTEVFGKVEYVVPDFPSAILIDCRQAQMSAAVLGLLFQASAGLTDEPPKTVHLDLLSIVDQSVIFQIRSPSRGRAPNISGPSHMIRNHSGSVIQEGTRDELRFRVEIPRSGLVRTDQR